MLRNNGYVIAEPYIPNIEKYFYMRVWKCYVYNSCGVDLLFSVKIAYHCFSCDKNITDIEAAEEHSKSLSHEVNEMIQRADEDGDSFLVWMFTMITLE